MGTNNIGEYFANLSKISDDLHTPKKIKVEVRPITGGRRFSVVDEKGKKFEFSIKDLINHTLSLANGSQSTLDQKAKLEGIVTKLKSLDQEGKDLLDSDETPKIARLLTQIRSLFGNLFHGKKKGLKELSSIAEKHKPNCESLVSSALKARPDEKEDVLSDGPDILSVKPLKDGDEELIEFVFPEAETWGELNKLRLVERDIVIMQKKQSPLNGEYPIKKITYELKLDELCRVSSQGINSMIKASKTLKGSKLPSGFFFALQKEQLQVLVLSDLTDEQLNEEVLANGNNKENFKLHFGDEPKLLQAHIHRLERSNMKLISLETFQRIDFTKLSASQLAQVIQNSTKAQARMISNEQLDKLDLSLCAKEELDKLCGRNSKRTEGFTQERVLDRDAMLQKNPTYKNPSVITNPAPLQNPDDVKIK